MTNEKQNDAESARLEKWLQSSSNTNSKSESGADDIFTQLNKNQKKEEIRQLRLARRQERRSEEERSIRASSADKGRKQTNGAVSTFFEKYIFHIVVLALFVFGFYLAAPSDYQSQIIKAAGGNEAKFFLQACKLKSVCSKFSDVRQSCAEAGSIDRCIAIKMNGAPYEDCDNEGHISLIPENAIPSSAQCLLAKIRYMSP